MIAAIYSRSSQIRPQSLKFNTDRVFWFLAKSQSE